MAESLKEAADVGATDGHILLAVGFIDEEG